MIKRSGFLLKREDLTPEQFRQYWVEQHAPLVRELAAPMHYVINVVDREQWPDFPYDGFSELWFETPPDAATFAPGSPIKEDEKQFLAGVHVVTMDEHTVC